MEHSIAASSLQDYDSVKNRKLHFILLSEDVGINMKLILSHVYKLLLPCYQVPPWSQIDP